MKLMNMDLYEGIKNVAKVIQQADNIKLYQQLLDLGAQALEMQNEINRLTTENAELKKQNDLESRIKRHKELYLNLDSDESVLYCSHCWDAEKKLIQIKIVDGKYICPHCGNSGIYDKEEYRRVFKNNMPRFGSVF